MGGSRPAPRPQAPRPPSRPSGGGGGGDRRKHGG
jgi:hypothetical protein